VVKRSSRIGRGGSTAADARPLPLDPASWVTELRAAYEDAYQALPFMPLVGVPPSRKQLFHLAPHVAIKFRGLPESERRAAVEAALASIAASEGAAAPQQDPFTIFAFSYLAAHFGLGLVSEEDVQNIMGLVERGKGQQGQPRKNDDA
jgi:hypothetical protein